MSEDDSGQEGAAGSPSHGPGALLPPSARGDLALRHACQCFGDALGRFIELRRSATVDPEAAEQSDTTRLAAARSEVERCPLGAERSAGNDLGRPASPI